MKVLTIVGARPQFVKAAVVSRALQSHENLSEVLVHTGQHYDANMSDVFFREMDLRAPKYNLEIKGCSHGESTGKMLIAIEEVLNTERPDRVLVYGDTNSTLAGALAASKLQIPIAHVEAGLRSFNRAMPEEINRILTDRLSTLLLCPTETAVSHLHKEGGTEVFPEIHLVGDVMYDAFLFYRRKALAERERSTLPKSERFALCTIHRQENTDDPKALAAIVESLNVFSSQIELICPLHPRTRARIDSMGLKPRFTCVPPQGYFEMLRLLTHCQLVLTDSGGLQKEAYFAQKPCFTIRTETEWTELVAAGVNFLVPPARLKDFDVLGASQGTLAAAFDKGFYGRGGAGEEIATILAR
jgi:UDP-GlcNAc3NAcA epimerase